jgi:hypothetical protein
MGFPPAVRVTCVVVVLMQTAAAARAGAPDFVCWPIQQGESASAVAKRLTGDPAASDQPSFQILDPRTRNFVAKARYRALDAGWRACVAQGITNGAARSQVATIPDRSRYDVGFASRIALAVFMILLSWSALDTYVEKTRPIPEAIRRAGERFIAFFAHPLSQPLSTQPPIRSRLRFVRQHEQLHVLIAPGAGRRYPNLSDHRRNVEYDVNRVLQALDNHLVIDDRLRAEGQWVVIPLRLNSINKEAGGK